MSLLTSQEVDIKKKTDRKAYYAFLLDNIGPFPVEMTLNLPEQIFDPIWAEFYHYLTLVAETARPGGGRAFSHYVENYTDYEGLPNLSEITNYLAFETLSNFPNKIGLEYWLNISSLLEYGSLFSHLSEAEIIQCKRFEYLQELDHFSEIMDLSLLTKHLEKKHGALPGTEEILKKYLNLGSEEQYKPIAGRKAYINVGLERMLCEAAAKRRNCDYPLYPSSANCGCFHEYTLSYYPVKTSAELEAQFKVHDAASIGLVRTNFPYISLLLTSNSSVPLAEEKLKELTNICTRLLLNYGLEIGIAMFDGYIFEQHLSRFNLSILACQAFKRDESSSIQVKIVSVGSGAVLIYQDKKLQSTCIRGSKEISSFLGLHGATHHREIVLVHNKQTIKVILAPHAYGPALESIDHQVLCQDANQNSSNPLAWLMTSFVKKFAIPESARNLLVFAIKPSEIDIVERPQWSQRDVKQIPEFANLVNTYKEYLKNYKSLEINLLYAHVHADRLVDIHQKISIEVARAFKDELENEYISFRLHPLIDNLHVRDVFDYNKYHDLLSEKNLKPDPIITEDSLLIDRIGQGILDCFVNQDSKNRYQIVFEQHRAINVLFPDKTVVQLIDHMEKDGRLSCVTFDLAQIYYRQAPEVFEKLFREEILLHYPNTILGRWFLEHPNKNYHEIMFSMLYSNPDIQYRNRLFQEISNEIRPNINNIESTQSMRSYVDALRDELAIREKTQYKKVVSLYILEGSYDAQFDRYSKVHKAFALPGIDTYRLTFMASELGCKVMFVKS
ncbi:MAG: hypothetical protein Q8L98_06095 [Chlamydiales bacterium]|nr:hypothetical protein [Chlamydiales bacterium]